MAATNNKIEYAASSALTITLASLATSSTLVAGRQSTAVDNTSNKYIDYLLGGKVTTGTSPTTNKSIEVWVAALMEDSTWPDTFGATDAAVTVTSVDIKVASLALAWAQITDSTSNRTYYMKPTSVAALFGGSMPKKWAAFVVHDTAVNLNSTGSNHALHITPVYSTSGG